MAINTQAEINIRSVEKIHRSLTDFHSFIKNIRDNSAGNIASVIQLPARVTKLLADKADFDAVGLSAADIKTIMEDNFDYPNWDDQIADFNAVFTKVPALRSTIVNNIGLLVPSFNGDTIEFGAGTAQSALETQLDNVLQHYV